MFILCDTSSVLMLWRIAPDMFQEHKFGCVTLKEVHDELFKTQKFKSKYPWRTTYKSKIKILSSAKSDNSLVQEYFSVINSLITDGVICEKTDRLFDLSREDQKILACALANSFKISTGDGNIKRFANQEFSDDFKGNISPLEIVNFWINKRFIKWDDPKHSVIAEWLQQDENQQPRWAIKRFKKLTGRDYPGP